MKAGYLRKKQSRRTVRNRALGILCFAAARSGITCACRVKQSGLSASQGAEMVFVCLPKTLSAPVNRGLAAPFTPAFYMRT